MTVPLIVTSCYHQSLIYGSGAISQNNWCLQNFAVERHVSVQFVDSWVAHGRSSVSQMTCHYLRRSVGNRTGNRHWPHPTGSTGQLYDTKSQTIRFPWEVTNWESRFTYFSFFYTSLFFNDLFCRSNVGTYQLYFFFIRKLVNSTYSYRHPTFITKTLRPVLF